MDAGSGCFLPSTGPLEARRLLRSERGEGHHFCRTGLPNEVFRALSEASLPFLLLRCLILNAQKVGHATKMLLQQF